MDRIRCARDRLETLASSGAGGLLAGEIAAVAAQWRAEAERDIARLADAVAALRAQHEDARDQASRLGMSAESRRQAGIVCAFAQALQRAGVNAG